MSTRSNTDNLGHLDETQKSPTFLLYKDGQTVRNYRLIERIGEGSYGEVWKAERDDILVALKILKTTLNSEDSRRVLKSLVTLKPLQHSNLLSSQNYWSDSDRLYIEMELADGGSLKELLIACKNDGLKGIPKEELLWYFTGVAQALDFLHAQQPVTLHRDIKPGNILLVQGQAKLADFDLLRQVSADHTSTSTQGGTPVYMAPESIERNVFSPQTDLFSFAVTYAELRQGRLPFTGSTAFQVCKRILHEPPELSDIFDEAEKQVLLQALAKDPRQRFASCGAFVAELTRVVPWTAAPPAPKIVPETETRSDRSWADVEKPRTGWPRPMLWAMVLLLSLGIAGGSWLYAHAERTRHIHDLIAGRQYGEALQSLEQSRFMILSRTDLDREIAQRWWADLKEPGDAASLAEVRTSLLELDSFLAAFPEQEDARHRRARLVHALSRQIQTQVDQHLRTRQVEIARNLVTQNQLWLQDVAQTLHVKIDNKQTVLTILRDAQKRLARKDYEGCLTLLQTRDIDFVFAPDVAEKQSLFKSASQDLRQRDEAHQKLLAAVQAAIKNAGQLQTRLHELAQFRAGFPKTDWQPPLDSFRTSATPDLLSAVWASLHADKVDIGNVSRRLAELKKAGSQLGDRELAPLEAVIKAHGATPAEWNRAMTDLVEQMRLNAGHAVALELGKALVALERQKQSFRFEDLVALEKISPSANGPLLGPVLERLVRKDQWMPTDKVQSRQCAAWCGRIDQPSPWIQALKTECQLTSNQSGAAPGPWPEAGCYGVYVHALAVQGDPDRTQQLTIALDQIVQYLRTDARTLDPQRRRTAAKLLQSAVARWPRLDQEQRAFASSEDAEKATAWLTLVLELPEVEVSSDSLLDLTLAATKTAKLAGLELVRRRIESDKLDAATRCDGHYGLAKAYASDRKSAQSALTHFDEALKLKAGKRTTRQKLVADAAEHAYQLADAQMAGKQPNWVLAVDYSKRCRRLARELKDLDLEAAARLHGNAVRLQAAAIYNEKGGHKDKAKNALEYYRVLEETLKDQKTDAFLAPVLVEKLKWAPVRKDHLEANIALGENALAIMRKLADAKPSSEFWDKLVTDGLVYLALARSELLAVQVERRELSADRAEDRRLMLQSYRHTLDALYEARGRKRYADKWPGELAFRIGYVHYSASMLLKGSDRKTGQAEAKSAYRELSDSLTAINNSIKSMPEAKLPVAVQDAQIKIRKALPELEAEYKFAPRKSE